MNKSLTKQLRAHFIFDLKCRGEHDNTSNCTWLPLSHSTNLNAPSSTFVGSINIDSF